MRWIPGSVLLALVMLAACAAPVGVGGATRVPKDGSLQCANVCGQMGTTLADIVVMANNVGCVCEPTRAVPAPISPAPPAPPVPSAGQTGADKPSGRSSAAAAGGLAAVLLEEQQQKTAQAQYH